MYFFSDNQTHAFFGGAAAPHFCLINVLLLASSCFFFDIIPAKPAIKSTWKVSEKYLKCTRKVPKNYSKITQKVLEIFQICTLFFLDEVNSGGLYVGYTGKNTLKRILQYDDLFRVFFLVCPPRDDKSDKVALCRGNIYGRVKYLQAFFPFFNLDHC